MEAERRNEYAQKCKQKCACFNANPTNRRRLQEEDECGEQRTFVSFICETISVIAFIIFGSIVFWFAVGGVLFDFIKRLYNSDRCVKIVTGIVLSFLLVSISIQCIVNNKTDQKDVSNAKQSHLIKDFSTDKGKTQENRQKEIQEGIKVAAPTPNLRLPLPPPPPPNYMKISLKEKHLENLNGETLVTDISKKTFTLTITDEQKKEVFRTAKTVFVPELALENTKPALIFVLKDILLEDY